MNDNGATADGTRQLRRLSWESLAKANSPRFWAG